MENKQNKNKNKNENENDYEILYVHICVNETRNYLNCLNKELESEEYNKNKCNKLLNVFLNCQEKNNIK
jgi:hypothetical protein